jgi:hypothetical protein
MELTYRYVFQTIELVHQRPHNRQIHPWISQLVEAVSIVCHRLAIALRIWQKINTDRCNNVSPDAVRG